MPSAGEQFVRAFEEAWRDPVARFPALFHPEGTLYQQGMERPIAKGEIGQHTANVAALLTDQRVDVDRWASRGEDVFIEWTTTATFHGEAVSWSGASRFTLRDGLVIEEVAYFDTLPLRARIDPALRRGDMTAAALEAASAES